MNTDNADPNNPSSPDDSRDGDQSQGPLPGQRETHELKLDSYGVLVQDRPAKGRTYLLATGCLLLGGASAWLAATDIRARLPSYLVTLGVLLGILAFGPTLPLAGKERDNKRKGKKQPLGRLISVMIWAGLILALVGVFLLYGNHCGNNCGE
jgi:hypothetical protein